MVHQGIDECSACMSRCRMHTMPFGLLMTMIVIILIDDIEW